MLGWWYWVCSAGALVFSWAINDGEITLISAGISVYLSFMAIVTMERESREALIKERNRSGGRG